MRDDFFQGLSFAQTSREGGLVLSVKSILIPFLSHYGLYLRAQFLF